MTVTVRQALFGTPNDIHHAKEIIREQFAWFISALLSETRFNDRLRCYAAV